ncbi:alpha/beta hydrolase [Legionella dresdenensis]|uniref:Alpha/beta hydrolase n=1 Tax=Legionella dresdenensis TaxID=450200 RepID=A0ABV8CG25_9GAMM
MPLVLLLLLFITWQGTALAEQTLEIQVKQQKIALPYWKAEHKALGGVLIIQGGEPAHGSIFLRSLAGFLAKLEWSVLLLNTQQTGTPWIEQLPEGLSILRQQKIKRIVVVHYGAQAQQTLEYFNKLQAKQVNGLILLSAYDIPLPKEQMMISDKLRFPVFDIAGQFDYPEVLLQMKARVHQQAEQAVENANPEQTVKSYQSLIFPGAGHDYAYTRRMLAAYLGGWMSKLTEEKLAQAPVKPPVNR